MKKRILSILLCLCMVIGLLPNIAMADDTLKVEYVKTEGDIPSSYKGAVIKLEKTEFKGKNAYAVSYGILNTNASYSIMVNIEYDANVVVPIRTNNGSNGTWTNNTQTGDYESWMLTDPNDGGGYLGYRMDDTGDNMGFIVAAHSTAADDSSNQRTISWTLIDNTKDVAADIAGLTEDLEYTPPAGHIFYYGTSYFALKDGVTEDKFTTSTIQLYPGGDTKGTGVRIELNGLMVHDNAIMIGFPEPPETTYDVEFTVKAGTVPMPNAVITVNGTSTKGNTVNATGTTNASGVATIALPASQGNYTYTIKDVMVDGKTYTMTSGKTGGVNLAVSSSQTTATYTGMEEVKAAYPIRIKAFNASGSAVPLTGATLNFGALTVDADKISGNTASFTTASSGSQGLTLSGVDGYQNITAGTSNVMVNAISNTAATLTLGTQNNPAATVSIESDGQGQYIKLVLKQTVTNVTMPLPVPEDMTPEEAGKIQVTIKPAPGASQELKDELGPNGLVLKDSDITVTTGDDGKPKVTVTAGLPDGAYEMQVGGEGLENTKPTNVTVVTDTSGTGDPTHVVNVGGTPTLDTNGNVTGIAGGVTGSTSAAGSTDATTGNGSINLTGGQSGTTVTEGGNTTVSGGAVTVPTAGSDGASDLSTGGLLGSDTVTGNLTPAPLTDPMYEIEVKEHYRDASKLEIDYFDVTVYLKNASGTSGTFGMYFDSDVFDKPASVTLDSKLDFAPTRSNETNDAKKPKATIGSEYLLFKWQVKDNNTDADRVPLDGITSGRAQVATFRLPVKAGKTVVNTLKQSLDNRSIYTEDFTLTSDYAAMVAGCMDGGVLNQDALNQNLWSVWRPLGTAGATPSVHLDDAKATRGGFYQYYTDYVDGTEQKGTMAHDIWMQFILPEELFSNLRVDFWVTEPEISVGVAGPGVVGATIKLYESAEDATAGTNPTAELTTDANGYAHIAQMAGTYYYTVTQAGHWEYPTGHANRGSSDPVYDSYALSQSSGALPTLASVVSGYINPIMDPKTFHEVELIDSTGSAETEASITSPKIAYNTVDYYFGVAPSAGKDWNVGTGKTYADMATLAAAITATRYDVDKTANTVTGAFRTLAVSPKLTVSWDATRQMFKIAGTAVTGDPIDMDTLADGTTIVDKLRAGDITITLPNEALTTASYAITATPGNGGTVALKANNSVPAGQTTDQIIDVSAQTTPIIEHLSDGLTTSGTYTFAPSAGNTIDQVLINGVSQAITEQQKANGYSYQFAGIASDQTIYVTFKDGNDAPISDPYLSANVGPNGGMSVVTDGTSPIHDTLTGPATGSYTLGDATTLTVTITPDTDYEIDTLLVDGAAHSKGTPDSDGYYTDPLIINDLTLNDGDTHSVVVTFKPKGEASTHVVVTSVIAAGFGQVAPLGTDIYSVGSTPTYRLTPSQYWSIFTAAGSKSVMLGKADGTAKVDESDKAVETGAGTNVFDYTLPTLTENKLLEITFQEQEHMVKGVIRVAATVSNVAAATITFTREPVPGETDQLVITFNSDTTATASGSFRQVSFEHAIPAGVWSVKVQKQGYLDYTVTNFEIQKTADKTIFFGDSACNGGLAEGSAGNMTPVPLTPGDANGEGIAIAFNDAAVVVAGWINGAEAINKTKGDINESGRSSTGPSDTDDMALVLDNMYKGRETIGYTAFCALS